MQKMTKFSVQYICKMDTSNQSPDDLIMEIDIPESQDCIYNNCEFKEFLPDNKGFKFSVEFLTTMEASDIDIPESKNITYIEDSFEIID